jgi:hypothetical protein
MRPPEDNCNHSQPQTLTTIPTEHLSPHSSVDPRFDPDLKTIIDAWTTLPAPIKTAVLAIVKAVKE